MWEFHVYDSAKDRCNMISGRDLLIVFGFNLKVYEHVIEAGDEILKISTSNMISLDIYKFKYLNKGKISPE